MSRVHFPALSGIRKPKTVRNSNRNSASGMYAKSLLRRMDEAERTGQPLKKMRRRKGT